MSSAKHCYVPGCQDRGGTHQVLHRFPNPEKDIKRFRNWLSSIGGDVLGLKNEHIYKCRRVCHTLFDNKYLCRNNNISNIAVPTLNMPGPISHNRNPVQQISTLMEPTTSSGCCSVKREHLLHTSMKTESDVVLKENINPNTPMQAEVPHLSVKETSVEPSPGARTAAYRLTKKIFLTKAENKGRRFTLEEKIAALSILKQSPKGYRFFRKIFILPAQQTLNKLIQRSNLKPGINNNIFSQLSKKAETMKNNEKLCLIMFDEVSLKANVTYQEKKDKVTGFVDIGEQRKAEFADHAQVFMVRGLIHNYKQAISYTFSSSATKGPELAKQIKEIVQGVQQSGLIVVATVCDQGTNNRQALKLLLNETRGVYLSKEETPKENIILISDQEIIPLYDPPHLLKGMRNNLLTKNLRYTTNGVAKTAKWSHLQLLHKENPGYKGIRLIPKLTENHINPEKINKKKVKYASQIFSRTVASNMGYLADKKILPAECKETADLLLFIDNIFDSVNGSHVKNKHAKPLLGPATPNSVHNRTWVEEGIQIFKSMSFVTSSGPRSQALSAREACSAADPRLRFRL